MRTIDELRTAFYVPQGRTLTVMQWGQVADALEWLAVLAEDAARLPLALPWRWRVVLRYAGPALRVAARVARGMSK